MERHGSSALADSDLVGEVRPSALHAAGYTAAMKLKQFAVAVAVLAFSVPMAVSADDFGIQPTLPQLLSRVAALDALLNNTSVACAFSLSKQSVRAGEPFVMSWGSYGADDSSANDTTSLIARGEQTVVFEKPGKYIYRFTFKGSGGATAHCAPMITVTS